jgi:hypothetical protein
MTKVVRSPAPLLEAPRSRMLWLVGVLSVRCGRGFLRQVASSKPRIQAAIIAALLRGCAGFLVAAFVVMSMVREFNDKVLELMLAQPWPRAVYLFGKFVGFSAAALALAAIVSLPLAFLAPPAQVAIWAFSLACELVILAAMSLFCVITLAHVVPALAAVLGFYVLGRPWPRSRSSSWRRGLGRPPWLDRRASRCSCAVRPGNAGGLAGRRPGLRPQGHPRSGGGLPPPGGRGEFGLHRQNF